MSKKVAKKEEQPTEPKKEKKAEVKPQKSEKPTAEKSKQDQKGVHAMYKIENDKVTRLRPLCERCGPGYFMADHHDRYTCGHCGFTRYKRT
jgi:ubiquitin-small subunit ribosomal protein S27Ae